LAICELDFEAAFYSRHGRLNRHRNNQTHFFERLYQELHQIVIYAFGIDSNLVAGNRNNLVESFVSKSERIGYIATMNVAWDFFILRILYLFIQKAREVNRLGFADDGFLVFYQLIDDGRANTRINQGQLEIFDCKRQLFLLIEDFSDDFISSCL
jgi:hypothetical protein